MLAIRHIFEYLNGVPNTIWFDNDSALVKIENLEHCRIRRIIGEHLIDLNYIMILMQYS